MVIFEYSHIVSCTIHSGEGETILTIWINIGVPAPSIIWMPMIMPLLSFTSQVVKTTADTMDVIEPKNSHGL